VENVNRIAIHAHWGINLRHPPHLKITKVKRSGHVTEVVRLARKCNAMSSNTCTAKKEKFKSFYWQ
jgi:hypothetical protein